METINSKTKYLVDVIIPTYNNVKQLRDTVSSFVLTTDGPLRFIIVNNNKAIDIPLESGPGGEIVVIKADKNLGWTGGLARGLEESDSEFVVFANDDIFAPLSGLRWLNKMVKNLRAMPKIGAIGPTSNCVMGAQNMWNISPGRDGYIGSYAEVPFLIGFCMVVRRSALDEIGGVCTEMETGDDLDLSIRLRKAGYGLLLDRTAFIYHHGFQTGHQLYGTPDKPGGWNSPEMTDSTNTNLIKKHGFMEWWNMIGGRGEEILVNMWHPLDSEGKIIMKGVDTPDPSRILDLGCGDNLTVKGSIGLDKKVDDNLDFNNGIPIEDESFDLVIARHIIEHLIDPIFFVEDIKRVLTKGGLLLITTPDEEKVDGLMLDPTHVHVFTMASLTRVVEAAGLEVIEIGEGIPAMSFYIKATKVEV